MVSRLVLVCALVVVVACDNPNSPSNFAQISGNWSGTMESSNWTTVPVTLALSQASDAVNGTWATTDTSDWNGQITGTVTKTNFSGTFTISAPQVGGGQRCTGTAAIAGAASSGATTLTWTGPGFTGNCTGLPVTLRWALRR